MCYRIWDILAALLVSFLGGGVWVLMVYLTVIIVWLAVEIRKAKNKPLGRKRFQ